MRGPFMASMTAVAAIVALGCAAFPDERVARQLGEGMVAEAYPGMPEALTRRAAPHLQQDRCNQTFAG
jgi:hypothetical protein